MFRLGVLVFGTDMIGRNAYYCLKRLIRDYKISITRRDSEWKICMAALQSYIPYMPAKALAKKGEQK